MSDGEQLEFVLRVLRVSNADWCDEVWWRTDGEYAPVTFLVNCGDLFWWGTADAERLTPENIGVLEQCFDDLRAAGLDGPYKLGFAFSLFCARVRGMRPQGCCYPDDIPELWPLYDACGPEREVDVGNPYRPGERKKRPEAAK